MEVSAGLREAILARLPADAARLVLAVAEVCRARSMAAYLVGGVVRDVLLGRPVVDADVVVVGDAAQAAKEAAATTRACVVVFEAFGTARLVQGGVHVDVAPARTERYARPGALPQVSTATAIEEDLRRRDFTINALAVPLTGDRRELVDPWGGLADLQGGWLRALHERSFLDDPTRLLRAVRFSVRYGLTVEPRTRRWMREAVAQRALDRVSAQRRGAELRRALAERPVLPVADALQRWRLWDALCPTWRLTAGARRTLAALDADDQPLDERARVGLLAAAEGWLSRKPAELADQVRALEGALALTREERRALESLTAARAALRPLRRSPEMTLRRSTVDRYLRPLPVPALAWVAEAGGGPASAAHRWVRWYVEVGCHVRPHLSGRDLVRLGVPPGPAVGEILEGLRAAVLDGRIRTRAEEVAWLKRRLGRAWAPCRGTGQGAEAPAGQAGFPGNGPGNGPEDGVHGPHDGVNP